MEINMSNTDKIDELVLKAMQKILACMVVCIILIAFLVTLEIIVKYKIASKLDRIEFVEKE